MNKSELLEKIKEKNEEFDARYAKVINVALANKVIK